jgi:hypothetical protein
MRAGLEEKKNSPAGEANLRIGCCSAEQQHYTLEQAVVVVKTARAEGASSWQEGAEAQLFGAEWDRTACSHVGGEAIL